jgi:hypothetical protein
MHGQSSLSGGPFGLGAARSLYFGDLYAFLVGCYCFIAWVVQCQKQVQISAKSRSEWEIEGE